MVNGHVVTSLVLLLGVNNPVSGFQAAAIRAATTSLRNDRRALVPSVLVPYQRDETTFARKDAVLYSKLQSTTDGGDVTSTSKKLDLGALVKYATSVAIQMGLLFGVVTGLDALTNGVTVPFGVLFVLFYAVSLKSRVFNPLNNERPDLKEASGKTGAAGFGDRNMPSFTPPGFVFPIAWLLVNAPLRAYASSLVYQTNGGHFADPAILAFLFHLSVGDVWNTINNTERRYGASASAVVCVWLTAAFAAFMYYQVNPLTGKLLGGTLVWLTLACSLVITTWRINPDPNTDELDPLYPVERNDIQTEFAWFGEADDGATSSSTLE